MACHAAHNRHVSFMVGDVIATESPKDLYEPKSDSCQGAEIRDRPESLETDFAKYVNALTIRSESSSTLAAHPQALQINKTRRATRRSGLCEISEQSVEVRLPSYGPIDTQNKMYGSKADAIADLFTTYHDQINEFMTYDPINRIIQTYSALDQIPDEQARRSKQIETIWLPLRHSVILRDSVSRHNIPEPQTLSPSRALSNISELVLDPSSPYQLLTPGSSFNDEDSVNLSEDGALESAPSDVGAAFDDSASQKIRAEGDPKQWQNLWKDSQPTTTAAACLDLSNVLEHPAECNDTADNAEKAPSAQEGSSPTKTWIDLAREHILGQCLKPAAQDNADIKLLECNGANASEASDTAHLTGFKFTDYESILRERSASSERRNVGFSGANQIPVVDTTNAETNTSFPSPFQDNVEATLPPAVPLTEQANEARNAAAGSLVKKRVPIIPNMRGRRWDRNSSSGISSASDFDENLAPKTRQSQVARPSGATYPRTHCNKSEDNIIPDDFNLRVVGKGAQNSRFAKQGGKRVATLIDLFQARSIMATPSPQGPQRTPPRQYPGLGLTNRSPSLLMRQSSVLQPASKCVPCFDSSYQRSCSGISIASTQCDSLFGTTLEQMKRE